MNTNATAKLRHLRVSPRKVRLVVDLVRGMKVRDALVQLQFSKKHAALPVKKLIESAVANAAHNHSINLDTLVISEIRVDEGKTLYRWMPRAMGRATPLRKRMCHISVTVSGQAEEKKKEAKAPKKEKETKEVSSEKPKVEEKKPVKKEAKKTTKKSEAKK
ncbi:50S ribosomal protein L22 [Candidatus Nomurabacteria bacterium]|nr:50S ribosomal protein L22 [Candidatus Nomurabacteria bacterium]